MATTASASIPPESSARAASPVAAASQAIRPAAGAKAEAITLVTGDRVELAGGTARITPGTGRQGIGFAETQTRDGHYRVVPSDAMPLVASGKLDPRLFDVTALLKSGYGDAKRKDLPLIVTAPKAAKTIPGARNVRELPSLGSRAIRATKATAATTFWAQVKSGTVGKVWLDGRVRASLDQSVPQVGAPAAWQAGFTGKGVKVAVLDTGIDTTHPDLDDAVLEAKDFTETSGPTDYAGHGTHVASIITGSGDPFKGVAPDAQLLVGKVLDDGGYGYDSQIIAGMEWAAAEGAKVVNLSLGGCATDGTDPLSQAVNEITGESGTLFVVAAGNHPNNPYCFYDERVSAPAAADGALAVGSVTKHDELSDFSNFGPRVGDPSALKPEITGPGQDIVAAKAAEGWMGEPASDGYVRMSGTSMATPHVAGAAAILAQQHPDWKAPQLREALLASAEPNPELGVFQQGAGRVDVAKAIQQQVLPQPASLSFGRAEWPHGDDQPVSRQLTYRNTGTAPVTLDLAVTGNPTAGLFTVQPNQVTVPAGGTATATVTADTKVNAPDGLQSAWITATSNGQTVASTPAGVEKEVESYDLTVEAIDRAGQPVATEMYLTDPAGRTVRTAQLTGEPLHLRLPKGRYDLTSPIFTSRPPAHKKPPTIEQQPQPTAVKLSTDGRENDTEEPEEPITTALTLAARPDLVLDQDTTIKLDARKGKPVGADVDSEDVTPVGQQAAWIHNGWLQMRIRGGDDGNVSGRLFATPTKQVAAYPYTFGFTAALVGDKRGYVLHETLAGRIPDPPVFRVRDGELAEVRATLHGQGVATPRPATFRTSTIDESGIFGVPLGYDMTIPSQRTDFFSAGVPWGSELAGEQGYEIDYDGDRFLTYEPGRQYAKHWGGAAIGPVARPVYAYDRLWGTVGEFSSSTPQSFFSSEADAGISVTNTLRKNGQLVATNEDLGGGVYEAVQPDEAATYTLTTHATRDVGWSRLATVVDGKWTFKGPFTDFDRASVLGLRISGGFDLLNRAPGKLPFPLRVNVENANGSTPRVTALNVAASFDDGRTWKRLTVEPRPGGGYGVFVPKAPAGARYVSLRASARDATGGKVEQTVIRAYQLK
jgi:subtilisin family serine protease